MVFTIFAYKITASSHLIAIFRIDRFFLSLYSSEFPKLFPIDQPQRSDYLSTGIAAAA